MDVAQSLPAPVFDRLAEDRVPDEVDDVVRTAFANPPEAAP